MKKIKGLTLSISEYGTVVGSSGKVISQVVAHNGYLRINTQNPRTMETKREYIHKLMAETYLDAIDGKEHIDHIDGNKYNNHISNLRWCSEEENIAFYSDMNGGNNSNVPISVYVDGVKYGSLISASSYIAEAEGKNKNNINRDMRRFMKDDRRDKWVAYKKYVITKI